MLQAACLAQPGLWAQRPSGDASSFFFFFFLIYFFYLFYFWLHWGFVAEHRLFSSCSERGLLFLVVRGLLIVVASLVVEHGL